MSTWTHVTGAIRIDDMNKLFSSSGAIDLSKIFIRDTWYHPNKNGNLPTGSEGSIDVEFIDRNDDESSSYMRTVAFFGDLRDFTQEDCQTIKDWWYNIPIQLGKGCSIRQAVLNVEPEDGKSFLLTEKDMKIYEIDDYE